MVFTSYEFVLVFMPLAALLVLSVSGSGLGHRTAAKGLLFVVSLVFYAWWNPTYVPLLLAILGFNYGVGTWLITSRGGAGSERRRKHVLVAGIAVNIGALVYFKYTNFLFAQLAPVFGSHSTLATIVLPLGISFIVFQKIAFLVDAYNGEIDRLRFLDYAVFVTFFPQLISGPIVHHRELIPQLQAETGLRFSTRAMPVAISFFVLGALKKLVIADSMAPYVATGFDAAAHGAHLSFVDGWIGAFAYTFQIYFDFSGYTDIAIGLALVFGVRLPFNFNSPLKASGPIDYWGRWHITLTRFLTAYIYNPIAMRATRRRMKRRAPMRVRGVLTVRAFVQLLAVPTLITMFIAGAWHGAGYQFVVFGLIHGAYLVANHAWRNLRTVHDDDDDAGPRAPARSKLALGRIAMLLGAVLAIPYFRADSVATAWRVTRGMLGLDGFSAHLFGGLTLAAALGACLLITQLFPNTQELLGPQFDAVTSPLAKHKGEAPAVSPVWSWPRITWRPSLAWAIVIGIGGWVVLLRMAKPTEFLYFQF